MNRFKAPLLLFTAILSACSVSGSHTGLAGTSQVPDASKPALTHPLDVQGGGPAMGGFGGGMMSVMLGDSAPQLGSSLRHLYVGIDRVDVTSNGVTQTVASYSNPQIVDLLAYQGDAGDQVANTTNAAQSYSSITFVLDIPSSQAVYSDGTTLPVNYLVNATPQSSSGADATMSTVADGPAAVDVTSTQGFTAGTAIRADFNAFESFGNRNGTIYANPVIYVAQRPLTSISGTIVGHYGNGVQGATIVAYRNGVARSVANTAADGTFTLGTLAAGSYNIAVYNAYQNAAGAVFYAHGQSNSRSAFWGPSITVQQGQAASVGTIAD